jgi:ADP-ribose pyrophosphatase YjhB (NUDIX family)
MSNVVSKFHVGVYGIIRDGVKIALILKGRGPYTGMLDLPGGKIEYGESVEDCLKREIKEEIGAEIETCNLRTVVQNSITYNENSETIKLQHVGVIFDVVIKNNQITSMNEHDVLESKWYDISSIDKELTFLAKIGLI